MPISDQQAEKSRRQYAEFQNGLDEGRIRRVLGRFRRKIDRLGANPPRALAGVWDDVRLAGNMLNDYIQGHYKTVPWKVIASLTGAVVYFVTPFDAVFDYIPVSGFLDDAMIITMALDFARDDLRRYSEWKRGLQTTQSNESETAE